MTTEELIREVAKAGEEYASYIEALPAEVLARRPVGGEWSVAEISGHIAEVPVFQATTISRLLQDPTTQFGRPPDDTRRLGAVSSLLEAGPHEIAAAVRHTFSEALVILTALPEDAWQARGQHMDGSERSVTQMVETTMIMHTRAHLRQAQEIVTSL